AKAVLGSDGHGKSPFPGDSLGSGLSLASTRSSDRRTPEGTEKESPRADHEHGGLGQEMLSLTDSARSGGRGRPGDQRQGPTQGPGLTTTTGQRRGVLDPVLIPIILSS